MLWFGPQYVNPALETFEPMKKKQSSTVLMFKVSEEFTVATNEGPLKGHAGDFLAHDPQSGHWWPVAAEYVAMHYEKVIQPQGYGSHFYVGAQGDNFVIGFIQPPNLSRVETLTLAAWLVAMADPSGDDFNAILEAVKDA